MRVTCPKCQFENQADSSRVVCARCATIIEVRPEAGMGGYNYNTNFDDAGFGEGGFESGGGLRSTANYSSPYASGNYGGGGQNANYPANDFGAGGGYGNANYPTAPVARPGENDVYATRIDDDFDDVLDIPRSTSQQGYQANETAPVFEDVFSTPDYGLPRDQRGANDQYQSGMNDPYQGGGHDPYAGSQYPSGQFQGNQYPGSQQYPSGQFQGGGQDQYRAVNQGHDANFDNPSFGVPSEPEFMGWPVLPEDSTDPGVATGSGFDKKSSLMRMVIIAALAVGGLFIIYSLFFSGGPTGNRTKKAPDATSTAESAGTNKTAADDIAALNGNKTKEPESGPVGPTGTSTKPTTEKTAPETTQAEKSPVNIPPTNANGKVLTPEKTTVKPPITKEPEKPIKTEPEKPAKTDLPSVPNRGNITIQVGSFPDRAQADDRASRLSAAGVTPRIVAANIPGRGTWYRVQIGKFGSRDQAASFASQLRGRGLVQDFMVTPVN